MSSRRSEDGEVGWETPKAGRTAWSGRAMLALVPLVILAATGHNVLRQLAEERWREFSEEFRRAPLPETRRAIDERVEDAFAPVYARIPALLDWHYSFFGQYAELGLVLLGRLEGEIESRLFGGLEAGISVAREDVGRVMQEEMLTELERWFDRDVASLPAGLRTGYERMLEPLLEDAKSRFVVSIGPTAFGATLAGVGTSVAVKALTTRLAQKLASGAAIRAAGGILGRSAGLVVAGVAGVAVDIAVRKLDELRNWEGLEQALTALVDEEKEKVKSALSSEVDDVKLTALGDFIPSELR